MEPKTESSSSENDGGEKPPDRFIIHNKIGQQGPKRKAGSFLIDKNNSQILGPLSISSLQTTLARIEIVFDISHCFNLWEEFSPKKSLFDTWEFRLAFYKGYGYKPYFLLLRNKNENLAFLPLWYDEDKRKYTWFGSDWQEEVRFFTKDLNLIPILLSAAPSPLYLNAIAKDSINPLIRRVKFENDEPKYILNLEGFKNHEDYLTVLKKNRRRNLRKDKRRIERQNPKIVIDNFSDFEHLVRLSKERFKQKGEKTDWEDPRRVETFRQVIKLSGKSYQVRMISIKMGEKTAGVDLICLFNKTYFAIKCGYNIKEFSGIGNFINLFEIDDAISLGMEKIDFLQNNYEWKDKFFEAVPLLRYEK